MDTERAKQKVFEQRLITKSLQTLMGIVNGLVCDDELIDTEIKYLATWLLEHEEISKIYPVNVIHRRVREVLSDNKITADERDKLLKEFKVLTGNDFTNTGSALPEHIQSVFDDDPTVIIPNNTFVLTGEFLFGTRNACYAAIEKRDGITLESVSRKTNYLIVGSLASPSWIVENFGRKIQKAAEMSQSGDFEISIIREADWAMAL
jgi:NAD-dependent DNA ligase